MAEHDNKKPDNQPIKNSNPNSDPNSNPNKKLAFDAKNPTNDPTIATFLAALSPDALSVAHTMLEEGVVVLATPALLDKMKGQTQAWKEHAANSELMITEIKKERDAFARFFLTTLESTKKIFPILETYSDLFKKAKDLDFNKKGKVVFFVVNNINSFVSPLYRKKNLEKIVAAFSGHNDIVQECFEVLMDKQQIRKEFEEVKNLFVQQELPPSSE